SAYHGAALPFCNFLPGSVGPDRLVRHISAGRCAGRQNAGRHVPVATGTREPRRVENEAEVCRGVGGRAALPLGGRRPSSCRSLWRLRLPPDGLHAGTVLPADSVSRLLPNGLGGPNLRPLPPRLPHRLE